MKALFKSWASEGLRDWPLALWASLLLGISAVILGSLGIIPQGDVPIYAGYASSFLHGAWPYRDIALEYPPGTLPFIVLAYPLGKIFFSYMGGFLLISMIAVSFILRDILKYGGLKKMLPAVVVLFPILQFAYMQVEMFVAATLYFAVRAVYTRRFSWAAVFLGLATLIKAYPIICLPAFMLAIHKNKRPRFVLVLMATVLIGLLPFLILSPGGLWQAFTYHSGRPIQNDSLYAALGILSNFLGASLTFFVSHKSWAAQFYGSHFLAVLNPLILLAGFIILSWFLVKSQKRRLALGASVLLLFFILFFKVGSPQFFVPFVFVGTFVTSELSKTDRPAFIRRLSLISLVIGATVLVGYRWMLPIYHWYGGLFIVLRTALEIELFVWLIQRLKGGVLFR